MHQHLFHHPRVGLPLNIEINVTEDKVEERRTGIFPPVWGSRVVREAHTSTAIARSLTLLYIERLGIGQAPNMPFKNIFMIH